MLFIQKLYEKMNESEKEVLLKPSWFFPFWKHPLLEIIELPRKPRQFNVSWDYLLLPHRITGVATISRALRKQQRAQRMSSSFLLRPQLGSGRILRLRSFERSCWRSSLRVMCPRETLFWAIITLSFSYGGARCTRP